MESTIFIARIIGPFMLIAALGIIFNPTTYERVMEDFFKNSALVYIGGAIALLIGLIIVLNHNIWIAGWPVVITIFGWVALVKGAWLIVFPNIRSNIAETFRKNPALMVGNATIMLILGGFLTAMGYFVR